MRVTDLIEKKRDGGVHSRSEIAFLIGGYTRDEIPDYQMSAWLMAVFHRGMNPEETQTLVEEMLHSGAVLDHKQIREPKVDKHSTGGVGDKTSLVVAPAAAACGVAVPMISGRGLAHTGGTLDKLEAIPGFRTDLSLTEFRKVLKRCGLALIGQTTEIAPADSKLYALRDLTATVPCPPLICGSIMSKKLAEGIDALVLDVKLGNGAFMRDEAQARELAKLLVKTGRKMGKKCVALITDMNQPIGRCVGNAVETREAIETLHGNVEGEFASLSIELAAHMLVAARVASNIVIARSRVRDSILSGAALERFRANIEAQGGNPAVLDNPGLLPQTKRKAEITSTTSGFVTRIDTAEIGRIVMDWGGGRKKLKDPIDLSIGLEIHAKLGNRVSRGDVLVTAFFNDKDRFREMERRVRAAYKFGSRRVKLQPLVREVM
jgi:pyrimidine-nucleoside phosphorylase